LIGGGAMLGSAALSGGDKGGGGTMSTQTREQKLFLKDLINKMLMPQVGQGIDPYSGDRQAPWTPLMQQGADFWGGATQGLGGLAGALPQAMQQYRPQEAFNLYRQAKPALQGMLQDFDPSSTLQAWQQGIVEPGKQNWQDIQRGIMEKYAGANAAQGGGVWKALGRAGEQFATNQNAQLASMMWQGEQAQKARQAQGIGQSMQMSAMPGATVGQAGALTQLGGTLSGQGMGVGQQQQQFDQQGLDILRSIFEEGQPYNNPYIQQLAPLALGTQAASPYWQQPSGGMGQAAMAPLGAMLGSQGFWNSFQNPAQNYANTNSGWGQVPWGSPSLGSYAGGFTAQF
tara:strand:- start:429 stop:1457 length:1029 start_codon:yes stop_codon:yes gene_type:complete